jgi:hypothetical protein
MCQRVKREGKGDLKPRALGAASAATRTSIGAARSHRFACAHVTKCHSGSQALAASAAATVAHAGTAKVAVGVVATASGWPALCRAAATTRSPNDHVAAAAARAGLGGSSGADAGAGAATS